MEEHRANDGPIPICDRAGDGHRWDIDPPAEHIVFDARSGVFHDFRRLVVQIRLRNGNPLGGSPVIHTDVAKCLIHKNELQKRIVFSGCRHKFLDGNRPFVVIKVFCNDGQGDFFRFPPKLAFLFRNVLVLEHAGNRDAQQKQNREHHGKIRCKHAREQRVEHPLPHFAASNL